MLKEKFKNNKQLIFYSLKKVIGILSIAVIAATMIFSANASNGSAKDVTLSDFVTLNAAHADWPEQDGETCNETCSVNVFFPGPYGYGGLTKEVQGHEDNCYPGPGCCRHTNCE